MTPAPKPAAHTPTPWRIEGDTLHIVAGHGDSAVRVLTVDGSTEEFKVDRANAAFIVAAVNCHEELLKIAKTWHGSHPEGSIKVCAACQLIARAEGKQ